MIGRDRIFLIFNIGNHQTPCDNHNNKQRDILINLVIDFIQMLSFFGNLIKILE